MAASASRPLWQCPVCRHRFASRNLWHSCGRHRLADHFRGKPSSVREAFSAFLRAARSCGRVTCYAQKTRIVIQARVRFAGGSVLKSSFRAGLWLKRRAVHPCLVRVESLGSAGYAHYFKLTGASDVDPALIALVREAYEAAITGPTGGRRA